ncbi:hypothetical protein [Microbulbifer marinus]|uniref:Uncharacterized protein n=1 Tax=Microbulbifer marinus TaxID=658218 RepID=A0A1H3Z6D8_9GAMM|nr:hypothetical protein [Microbulbifer marinus]SEA19256.1 hypothetical protein SAMN05216562_2221 [Microbulbifer marinus]
MSYTIIHRLLLTSAVFIAPALATADGIGRDSGAANLPGEMEYIEVIGEREADDAARERTRQARQFKQQQRQRSRLEQVHSLRLRQQQLVERFRAEKERALASEQDKRRKAAQEAAQAEELRRQQQRIRAEELRRQEEERLRTEAQAQQQEPS